MADEDAQPDAHEQAKALAKAHTVAAHAHLGDALGYLADDHYQPPGTDDSADEAPGDAHGDDAPRGMDRFTAKSATQRTGFPEGSGAARTLEAMRRR
jgi:hypothetical protein